MAEDWETMYPWDLWLDGTERVFTLGTDFSCSKNLAVWTARNAARRRGCTFEVTRVIDDVSFAGRAVWDPA